MKVLNTQQMRDADAHTIATQGITSWQLTERAATKLFEWVKEHLSKERTVTVLAGTGNNGGDGLALARMLIAEGWQVNIYLLCLSEHLSPDCQKNKELLIAQGISITEIRAEQVKNITFGKIVIDAVFGIGLNRPAPEWLQQIFNALNNSNSYVLSIDMPSGLPTERIPSPEEIWVHPHQVLTFQTPKLPFFLPSTGRYIRKWEVLNIGLDEQFLNTLHPDFYYLEADIQQLQRPRATFSHKGTYGHALLVGGSYGKMGAVVLSGTAVLRAGAGLLTVAIPQCGYAVLQTALPEAMVLTCNEEKHYKEMEIPFVPSAIGVGIGWGTHTETASSLFALFQQYPDMPFVVDADALNILAQHPEQLKYLPKNAILTPHPKELERLIGKWDDDLHKLAKAKDFAKKHQVILLIKGAYTMITDGEKYWINSTGNAGMATAGSGDVLTGMLTGLRAQGYRAVEATCLGVFLHGLQGDRAAKRIGMQRLMARDLL
ncbi:bifunctional NAD(P)H-hydrate repair enzyme [Capnocytophaga sp. HP1101]